MHRRPAFDLDAVLGATATEHHMVVAGGDESHPGDYRIATARLAHLHATEIVEAGRETGGEVLGHVLHDDGAGRIARQGQEHLLNGSGAACGGADGQHLVSCAQGSSLHRRRRRIANRGAHRATNMGGCSGPNAAYEYLGDVLHGIRGPRLTDDVDRADLQRLQCRGAAAGVRELTTTTGSGW